MESRCILRPERGRAEYAGIISMRFIGHRGASHLHPENTLRAVGTALDAGLGFEIDLQTLASGEIVLLHDDTLERTAIPSWRSWIPYLSSSRRSLLRTPISQLTLPEVLSISVGDGSHCEPVPLFAHVLSALMVAAERHPAAHCFAELKAEDSHHSELLRR